MAGDKGVFLGNDRFIKEIIRWIGQDLNLLEREPATDAGPMRSTKKFAH